MNSSSLLNIARFVLLLAAQILVFNNIHLFGSYNPFPYILFIILYPVNGNKTNLLISSFILGLTIDFFCNSYGIHAFASIILAYYRPAVFKFCFGLSYEYQTVKLNDVLTPERFFFILLSVLLHHTALFVMEIFDISLIWKIFYQIILSTIFTVIISIIIIYLIKPNKR
jgi:rod shape-determining protein MreD